MCGRSSRPVGIARWLLLELLLGLLWCLGDPLVLLLSWRPSRLVLPSCLWAGGCLVRGRWELLVAKAVVLHGPVLPKTATRAVACACCGAARGDASSAKICAGEDHVV